MREVRHSEGFKKFTSGGEAEVTTFDLLQVLHSGSQTRKEILRGRFQELMKFAEITAADDVRRFLEWAEGTFGKTLLG